MSKRGRPKKQLADGELSAKQKIVETALELFYQQGINCVGVDRIIEEAGIAKMTFFKHFPTKKDLILEFLKVRDERYLNWVDTQVKAITTNEAKQLEACLEVMAKWFQLDDFRGCAFINTTVEVGPGDNQEKLICVSHKNSLSQYLTQLATQAGYKNPEALADLLVIVIDGATIRAQMDSPAHAIPSLKQASEILLKNFKK